MATYWLMCNSSTKTPFWEAKAIPPTSSQPLLVCNASSKDVSWKAFASLSPTDRILHIDSATKALSWAAA